MILLLWIGSVCGAILGLLHAFYLYRQIAARYARAGAFGVNVRGLYYSIWTVALWTLFGSYVLALWLIGSFVSVLSRLILKKRVL